MGFVAFAATIPLGSVGFLASRLVAALAWLVGTVGLVWASPRGGNDRPPRSRSATVAMALLAAWCGWQLLPLPGGWAGIVWRGDAALWAEIMAGTGGRSIALDRFVSLHAALLWAGLGILAWACSRRLRGRRAVETALQGLMALGVFQSILGIFILKAPGGRICGTFGSPNALGGLLAMTLPVTLGLVFFHSRHRALRGRTGFRWWAHRLGDSWRAWLRPVLWTAWGVQWMALYFTGSIGATLASAAACGILLVWQGKEHPESRRFLVAMGVALAVLMVGFGVHARRENVRDRLLGDSGEFQYSKASRVEIWRVAWRLCQAFPQGTGPGGTALGLPMYQTEAYGRYRLDYAHNDTLQFLGDLGLPGFAPLMFLLGLTVWRGAKASRRTPGPEDDPVWLIRGAWLAMIAALLHAQVEFNLSARPGVQVAFAILCGILWGAPATPSLGSENPGAPGRTGPRIGIRKLALSILGMAAIGLSLSAAGAWLLHEGVAAAAGLPLDEYLWFRRPTLDPGEVSDAMRRACRLAPGSSTLRRTSAETRIALHRSRVQAAARARLSPEGADLASDAPLDPLVPAHELALAQAVQELRREEVEMLREALADADSAVCLAPWDASARLVRGKILLRGSALASFGPDAETRGRRDLEMAVGLYPMDAGVLAGACSALSRGADSDQDVERLLDWGSRALALDASLAWTVLEAWWAGHVRVSRVLELPRLPVAVLWNLYTRLDKLDRAEDARRCLVAMERRLEADRPPESSLLWPPSKWKRWNIQQAQCRIRLAGEWLKRNLREGDWKGVETSATSRAKARHERFQVELDRMELSGVASKVLRRLRLREWAATGGLSPEWTLEWMLLELEAATPIRQIQDPLAEMILLDGLDPGSLGRLRACRSALAESPFLMALLAAQEAESSGRLEEAAATLASSLDAGLVPGRLVHRAWLWRSRLLRRAGREPEAEAALRAAAQACSSDPDVEAALVESGQESGTDLARGQPALNLGFMGGRLLLKQACLENMGERTKEAKLHLRWRFLGGLPPDLRMDVLIRDEDGRARVRKAAAVDQEVAAKFNRGHPPAGSSWIWTIPLSSFEAQGRRVEVRLLAAGKLLPSDDGLAVVELNMDQLPRVGNERPR